ncbi:hypothetical protein [Candidatus Magnetaquicoccus inordinatus]|uniref:hypothetical protein n=1 Tax=Candidatus Magnetaquicoccus inordinatus TaxID=2496818 RepID=UPI00102CA003|nr:hypothetical protein [Candidatus Magnetaquicoccus inordinatus]
MQSGDNTTDLDYTATTALALNSGSIKDGAGNDATLTLATPGAANSLGNAKNIIVALAPSISAVSASTADGSYKAGDTVNVTVTFTEAITVTGNPYLTLETGTTDRNATYSSGSGTTTLTFAYTVQAGDSTSDLDYVATSSLNSNGGTLQNGSAVDAVLTLPTPGAASSLGHNKAIVIDTTAPSVSSVTSTTANGSYKAGDTVNVTVTFSEAITVDSSGGTPYLTLETGSTDRNASYASGSGSNTLVFSYTVQAGDSSSDLDYTTTSALALNGGTIKDSAGNDATLTVASPGAANSLGDNKAILIDTTAPTVSSVTSTSADGRYKSGDVINVTIHFSETVSVVTTGGTPYITLETGTTDRNASYASGSGSTALVFTYTVQAGDGSSDLEYGTTNALALNGGTIKDTAGNSATLTLAATASSGSLGYGKAIVVDTTVETPTVASPTINEDADSGAITITRSGNDGSELTYYQISAISGGTLYSDAGYSSTISNGDFIASGGATTNLYFRPTSNRNSTTGGNGSFTVQAATGNGSSYLGGSTATSTITLTAIADTPSVASPTINEDSDSGAIAITRAAGDGSETSYYKISGISGGSLYSDAAYTVAVNNGDFVASAGATTNLYFRPTANRNSDNGGNAVFTVQAASGANNLYLGGATVSSTITIDAVNDAPTFVKGGDQTLMQTANPITVPHWATAISSGPADESTQSWQFIVTNNRNEMFSVQPSIDSSGTLTYTPTQLGYGVATVSVQLQDNGGTARNGAASSPVQTFQLTVTRPPPPQPAPIPTPPAPLTSDKNSNTTTSNDGQKAPHTFKSTAGLPSMGDGANAPVVTMTNANYTPTVLKTGDTATNNTSSFSTAFLDSNKSPSIALPAAVPATTPQAPPPATIADNTASVPAFTAGSKMTSTHQGGFAVAVSPATGENGGLAVNRTIQDVAVGESGSISMAIPANAFSHSDANAQVTLAASQADGANLPNWLSFDPIKGKFEGTAPPGTKTEIAIKIVAQDNQGKMVVSIFRVKIGNKEGDNTEKNLPEKTDRPRSERSKENLFWVMLEQNRFGKEVPSQHRFAGTTGISRQLAWAGREGWLLRNNALQQASAQLLASHYNS